jgi:hypothetical protein
MRYALVHSAIRLGLRRIRLHRRVPNFYIENNDKKPALGMANVKEWVLLNRSKASDYKGDLSSLQGSQSVMEAVKKK